MRLGLVVPLVALSSRCPMYLEPSVEMTVPNAMENMSAEDAWLSDLKGCWKFVQVRRSGIDTSLRSHG